MRIFYDTEFIEDGRTIDLISIGMVAEDGRELYLVNQSIEEDPLWTMIGRHQWLMQHVVPGLPLREGHDSTTQPRAQYPGRFWLDHRDNRIVPRRFIRNAVRDFITEGAHGAELWAWYGAYDHVVLAQLFGAMIHLPDGVPMWTNDLQQEIARRGISEDLLPPQAEGLHNALADARHVKVVHEWLTSRRAA